MLISDICYAKSSFASHLSSSAYSKNELSILYFSKRSQGGYRGIDWDRMRI